MVRGHGNACRESVNMFPLDVVTLAQMRKSGCIPNVKLFIISFPQFIWCVVFESTTLLLCQKSMYTFSHLTSSFVVVAYWTDAISSTALGV